jgi:hypothetical protein
MCFVKQTAIFSKYNSNFLIFKTKKESVYCAARTESLNIIHVTFHLRKADVYFPIHLWPFRLIHFTYTLLLLILLVEGVALNCVIISHHIVGFDTGLRKFSTESCDSAVSINMIAVVRTFTRHC